MEATTMDYWLRVKEIGKGSYGSVYLAKSKYDPYGPFFAVKTAAVEGSLSLHKEKRIYRWLESAASTSKEIVGCFGSILSYEDDGVLHYNLLLEYAPHGSLRSLIKDVYGGCVPENDAKKYAQMILKGLSCIHRNGYVHCDLKPENILVFPSEDAEGLYQLKIADFGLAKEPGDIDLDDGVYRFRGTPMYMSPESVEFGDVTAGLDIWSLGCILVEMITGRRPWNVSDSNELVYQFVCGNKSPEIPENISEDGADFLRRCFEWNLAKRWNANMLLNHPFIAKKDSAPSPAKTQETSPSSAIDDLVLSMVEFVLGN